MTRTAKLISPFLFVSSLFLLTTHICQNPVSAQDLKLVINKGHSNDVLSVVFSVDGKFVISGSSDESVRVWELASGREQCTLEGPVGQVKCVAQSPDGKWIAAGDDNTNISIWNSKTGKRVKLIENNNDWITSVCFSPDSKWLASSSDDSTVRTFSVPGGSEKLKLRRHIGNVKSVVFSDDGKKLVSAGFDNTIRVWDAVVGGEPLKVIQHPNLYDGNVLVMKGAKISLSTNSSNGMVDFIDLEKGSIIKSLPKNSSREKISLNTDGSVLAAVGQKRLSLWNTSTLEKIRDLPGEEELFKGIAFNSDGTLLATCGNDGDVRIWNTKSGAIEKKLSGRTLPTSSLAISDDFKSLVSGSEDSNVRLWDLDSHDDLRVLKGHSEWVEAVAYCNDKNLIASGGWDRTIKVWDSKSGTEVHKFLNLPFNIHELAFSKDGTRLVVAGWALANNNEASVIVYDLNSEEIAWGFCPGYEAQSISLSSDGRSLLSGHVGNFACMWDVETGKLIRKLEKFHDSVDQVAYHPDGQTFICSCQDKVNVYKKDGTFLTQLTDITSHVGAAEFSKDGNFLATGHSDNKIKIWDARSYAKSSLKTLEGHSYYITSLAFGKDSKWLASSAGDGVLKFWNVKSGAEICTLVPIGSEDWAVVDPFGRFDASNLDNLTDLFWRITDKKTKVEESLPVEVFMRQYYTPRLLARLLNFEKLPDTASISNLNRLLPEVMIESVSPSAGLQDKVDVVVRFKSVAGRGGSAGESSGICDLRLLRDGQLVAFLPEDESFAEEKSRDLSGGIPEKEIRKTLTVRLPHNKVGAIKFTAYAFNKDKVKSVSHEVEYTPKNLKSAKGRGFVVGIGVNKYDDPSWKLKYAVNDARGFTEDVASALRSTGKFEDVVSIAVVSDSDVGMRPTDIDASKENIQKVFQALAGDTDLGNLKEKIPSLASTKVGPDDFVVLAISSHGDTDRESGEYYLFPRNIGDNQRKGLTSELKRFGISSSELTDWLKDVDAGDIAMIIDACHSGAAEGKDFRPGPMDSRGLGQLAYYKKMRILSASQSDAKAKERSDLKHGLLSYALLKQGLEERKADVFPTEGKITVSKWLRFGEREVPNIDMRNDVDYVAQKDAAPADAQATTVVPQTPKLLDFAGKRRDVLIWAKPQFR